MNPHSGISIADNFYFRIAVVNKNDPDDVQLDFIETDRFIGLSITEECRNMVPSFQMAFLAYDYSIIPYFNEGNSIEIMAGSDNENFLHCFFTITSSKILPHSTGVKRIDIYGLNNSVGYFRDQRARITQETTSVEALRSVVSKHFKVDFGNTQSSDSQCWIQSGVADKVFAHHLITHMELPSFPVVGITTDGTFFLRDLKDHVKNGRYDWRFTYSSADQDNDILYEPNSVNTSNPGLMNFIGATGTIIPVYNTDLGGPPIPYESSTNPGLLSSSRRANRVSGSKPAIVSPKYKNNNTYDNFWTSKSRNRQGWSMYSTDHICFSSRMPLRKVHVGQVAFLEDPGPLYSPTETMSAEGTYEPTSGYYIITKINRSVANSTFITLYQLSRETKSKMEGMLS
jgi:hypothetical protein